MTEHRANTGTFQHRIGTTDRGRLEILLRVAAEQWPHKTAEDQAHERRMIERDYHALTGCTLNVKTES